MSANDPKRTSQEYDLIARFPSAYARLSRNNRQEKKHSEDNQMHQALEHRGAARAQGDHPNEEGNCEQYLFFQIEPEFKRLTQVDGYGRDRWNSEADACECRP